MKTERLLFPILVGIWLIAGTPSAGIAAAGKTVRLLTVGNS